MEELGFPNEAGYRFRIKSQLFRVNVDGVEVLSILTEIYNASLSGRNNYWVLRWRKQIRRIEILNVRSVLSHVIHKTPSERMRTLAIWLRGRCGGYIGTSLIAYYAHSTNFQTQKESVRALRRMSGWSHLREIAKSATNSRIRNLATQRAGSPLGDRLSRVLTNFRAIQTSPQRQEVWTQPGLRLTRTPPKTVAAIRRILERIKLALFNTKR
jgi:hypothetical protein